MQQTRLTLFQKFFTIASKVSFHVTPRAPVSYAVISRYCKRKSSMVYVQAKSFYCTTVLTLDLTGGVTLSAMPPSAVDRRLHRHHVRPSGLESIPTLLRRAVGRLEAHSPGLPRVFLAVPPTRPDLNPFPWAEDDVEDIGTKIGTVISQQLWISPFQREFQRFLISLFP